MNVKNTWDKTIIKLLLNDKGVACKEINHLETLYSLLFDSTKYPEIKLMLEEKKLDNLKQFDNYAAKGFSEYLDIVKFTDEENKPFIAAIYDSVEVWQDPLVLDVFPA